MEVLSTYAYAVFQQQIRLGPCPSFQWRPTGCVSHAGCSPCFSVAGHTVHAVDTAAACDRVEPSTESWGAVCSNLSQLRTLSYFLQWLSRARQLAAGVRLPTSTSHSHHREVYLMVETPDNPKYKKQNCSLTPIVPQANRTKTITAKVCLHLARRRKGLRQAHATTTWFCVRIPSAILLAPLLFLFPCSASLPFQHDRASLMHTALTFVPRPSIQSGRSCATDRAHILLLRLGVVDYLIV